MGCIHNARNFLLAIRTTHQSPFIRTYVAATYGGRIGTAPKCGIFWACILAYLDTIDKPIKTIPTLKNSSAI